MAATHPCTHRPSRRVGRPGSGAGPRAGTVGRPAPPAPGSTRPRASLRGGRRVRLATSGVSISC